MNTKLTVVEARNMDTAEFAEKYNINIDVVKDLMRSCRSCSYTNNPLQAVEEEVKKFERRNELKIINKENLIRFIHFNLNSYCFETTIQQRGPKGTDFYRW
jgi:hypothetical protein